MGYNIEGVLCLRNAIVEQAAKDYLSLKKSISKLEEQDKISKWKQNELDIKRSQLAYLVKWFMSDSFGDLDLKVSGAYIVERLDEIDESKQIRHKRIQEREKNE